MNSLQLLREAQFHGAKRLASSKYRCYWALALLVLFCCSLTVLTVAVNRYFQNPTYFTHRDVSQSMKPFPTVVLCPEVEFPQYKITAFVQDLKYPTGINASYLSEVIPQLGAFFSPNVQYVMEDLEKIQDILDYNNISLETAGIRLTPNCGETIIRCRWLNSKYMNCSKAFRFELTSYGFCCIFNGYSLKRHHEDRSNTAQRRLYVNSIGFTDSLIVAVNQSMKPRGNIGLSYKWLSLQTAEYTDILLNGTPISPAVETWAGYKSERLHITDDAESLGNDLRQCRMMHERLKYFPIYHKRYCLLECEMDRVIQQCNCVRLVHLHMHVKHAMPICNAKHIACVRETAGISFSRGNNQCQCLTTCDNEIETTIIFNHDLVRGSQEIDDFYANLDFNEISIIRIFLLEYNRKVMFRHSYFPTFQLFSQLGGIFGVFFGCSILSLLEMVQLICYACLDIFHQRQEPEKELELTKHAKIGLKYKK